MKLNTNPNKVERFNTGAESAFQIKTTSKAFDILSSGLYTDGITAIIRELSCNAYDSHVAAGKKDEPFTIHLPNVLEPWFSVTDNGTGLSEEDVLGLYTTYFDSTKTDSNDYIGALGLGSKSPFAYANSFEVISRFNKKQKTYSVFINEQGIPSIVKMGEVDTQADNGVEVKLAVKTGDFHIFKDKAERVLRWFEKQPDVVGCNTFVAKSPVEKIPGLNWGLFDKKYQDPDVIAIQGNIAYRVSVEKIIPSLEIYKKHLIKLFDNKTIVMFFDIGDLDVAASREEIRYNKSTMKSIESQLSKIPHDIGKMLTEAIKDFKTNLWDFIVDCNEWEYEMFKTRNHQLANFLKKNPEVVEEINNKNLDVFVNTTGRVMARSCYGWKISSYVRPSKYGNITSFKKEQLNDTKRNQMNPRSGIPVHPDKSTMIAINDVPSGGVTRLKEYAIENKITTILSIQKVKNALRPVQHRKSTLEKMKADEENGTRSTWSVPKGVPVSDKWYADELKQIKQALGNPDIKIVSECTDAKKRTTAGKVQIYKHPTSGYSSSFTRAGGIKPITVVRQNPENFKIENGGFYYSVRNGGHIIIKQNDKSWKRVACSRFDFGTYVKTALNLIHKHKRDIYKKIIVDTNLTHDHELRVFGVGARTEKLVEAHANWFNIFDLMEELAPDYDESVNFWKRIKATTEFMGIHRVLDDRDFILMVDDLDDDTKFKNTVQPIIEMHKKHSAIKEDSAVLGKMKRFISFDDPADNTDPTPMAEPLFRSSDFDKYPMLQFVECFGSKNDGRYAYGHTSRSALTNQPESSKIHKIYKYIKLIDRTEP